MSDGSPEFSRPRALDAAEGLGGFAIAATAEERARLEARLDLAGLDHFNVEGRIAAAGANVTLDLSWTAGVRRICVVTLEEFAEPHAGSETLRYRLQMGSGGDVEGGDEEIDDLDAPEILTKPVLDVGEEAVQMLALALDPHPRKPGLEADASHIEDAPADEGAGETRRPFADLGAMLARPQGLD